MRQQPRQQQQQQAPTLPGMPRPEFGGVRLRPGFESKRPPAAGQLGLFVQWPDDPTPAQEMAQSGAVPLFD